MAHFISSAGYMYTSAAGANVSQACGSSFTFVTGSVTQDGSRCLVRDDVAGTSLDDSENFYREL